MVLGSFVSGVLCGATPSVCQEQVIRLDMLQASSQIIRTTAAGPPHASTHATLGAFCVITA